MMSAIKSDNAVKRFNNALTFYLKASNDVDYLVFKEYRRYARECAYIQEDIDDLRSDLEHLYFSASGMKRNVMERLADFNDNLNKVRRDWAEYKLRNKDLYRFELNPGSAYFDEVYEDGFSGPNPDYFNEPLWYADTDGNLIKKSALDWAMDYADRRVPMDFSTKNFVDNPEEE